MHPGSAGGHQEPGEGHGADPPSEPPQGPALVSDTVNRPVAISHAVVVICHGSHRTLLSALRVHAPAFQPLPGAVVPSGHPPPPLPWALPSPALASSTRPAVGASLFRGQAAVPRGPLAWTGMGAWAGKTISSAPQEACDVVAETDPTQGVLLMTNTVLTLIIHEEHLGRCSKHTGRCFLLFPLPCL